MPSWTAGGRGFTPVVVVAMVASLGCGEPGAPAPTPPPPPPPAAASVAISPSSASIIVGQTTTLTATVKDAAGQALSGRSVTWASDLSSIATVSQTGVVEGVSVGQATITATSEGKSAGAIVEVKPIPVATVDVTPPSASVVIGGSTPLAATARDAQGNVLTGRAVTWTSRNAGVATVASDGLVTATGIGTTAVLATIEGATDSAIVQVTPPPVATVTVEPSTATVAVGSTRQLTATAKDQSGNTLSGRAVDWSTSATGVATVSNSGLVTAVGAGSATITADVEGVKATAAITVPQPPVAAVVVSPATTSVVVGQSVALTASARDGAGNPIAGKTAQWTTSDPAIATVTGAGLVTTVGLGPVTIRATIDGIVGLAAITVTLPPVPTGPNFIQFGGDPGDGISGGRDYRYTQSNAVLTVTANGGLLSVGVHGDEQWTGEFQLPASAPRLQVGYYSGLMRYPFHNPTIGGLTWSGDGRGCNTSTGSIAVSNVSYAGTVLTGIDLTFEQHCEDLAPALRGAVHWRSNDPTAPPGPATPPASLWRPAPGTTPPTGNFVRLVSDAGDFIGAGGAYTYTPANAGVTVTATGGLLRIDINGNESWTGNFQVMNVLTQLAPGYYPDLIRYPFHNPTKGGLTWYGQGRGCNTLAGWFVVDAVTYQAGVLKSIELRFEQRCGNGTAALRGAVRWTN